MQSRDRRAHLLEIGPAGVALREVLVRPASLGLGQLALEVVRDLLDELLADDVGFNAHGKTSGSSCSSKAALTFERARWRSTR